MPGFSELLKAVATYTLPSVNRFVVSISPIEEEEEEKEEEEEEEEEEEDVEEEERKTRIDVYETLCPQQMLAQKGGQIKKWGRECRDVTPTKLQCQNIQRALQVFYKIIIMIIILTIIIIIIILNQRTNGPVNAHLIS